MELQTEINVDGPKRRAARQDVKLSRAAIELMRPINQQIGHWQVAAARLVSVGERARTHGRHSPSHVAELEALEKLIVTQTRRFNDVMAGLPLEIGAHGRITDTRRALETVALAVARARGLLGP